jgi:hypothetical protein
MKTIGKTVHADQHMDGRPVTTNDVKVHLLKHGDYPRNISVKRGNTLPD